MGSPRLQMVALGTRVYSLNGTLHKKTSKNLPYKKCFFPTATAISINAASEIWENVYMSERPGKEKIYLRARRHDV